MLTRRRFLQLAAATAGLGVGAGLYAWRWEPHWLEIVERDLPVKHLPEPLAESRLVQLSDLHIGFRVNDDVRPEVTLFRLTSRPSPSGPAATDTV